MSVLMVLRVSGDSKAVESTDPAVLKTVTDRAKDLGATRHRFFTNGSEVLVVDEWPDQATFQQFFDSSPEIPEIMAAAGVTAAPTIEFWERVGVDDAFGWD